jgi:hypothetical protein
MNKSPKHEHYTPEQLAQEWSELTGKRISIDKLFHYGYEGRLKFVVANSDDNSLHADGELGDDYIEFSKLDDKNVFGLAKFFPITADELKYILSGNTLTLNSYVEFIEGKKVEFLISPVSRYYYDKSSLRISGDEVASFENKYFEESAPELKGLDNEEEVDPTWDDFFTNPPSKETDVFTNIRNAVISYLVDHKKKPSREQLWEHLKLKFTYNIDSKTIEGISSKKMDKENYRSNFNRWTKKTSKLG